MQQDKIEAMNIDQLMAELVKIRVASNLTQRDVAKRMDTTSSSIGRLETGGGKRNHSPTLRTLNKYINAIGARVVFAAVKGEMK